MKSWSYSSSVVFIHMSKEIPCSVSFNEDLKMPIPALNGQLPQQPAN